MSKMTFDELLEYLTQQREIENEEEFNVRNLEFMNEVLNVGKIVLSDKSDKQIAGMLTVVQTILFQSALGDGDLMMAALVQSDLFTNSLHTTFKACAGILTMEEVR